MRQPSEAVDGIELLLLRLFEDIGQTPPESMSQDNDELVARFKVGDLVYVRLSSRNHTARRGVIVRAVWHHKHQGWMYFLMEDGKRVKKRYFFEDLAPQNAG